MCSEVLWPAAGRSGCGEVAVTRGALKLVRSRVVGSTVEPLITDPLRGGPLYTTDGYWCTHIFTIRFSTSTTSEERTLPIPDSGHAVIRKELTFNYFTPQSGHRTFRLVQM